MKLVHFKSYSCDNYYTLVEDDFNIKTALEFCRKYMSWGFKPNGYWTNSNFQYTSYKVYDVLENGLCIIPLSFDEIDVIDTFALELNKSTFSDHVKYFYNETPDGNFMYYTEDIPYIKSLTRDDVQRIFYK